MIVTIFSWRCTLCDYGKSFDPSAVSPPLYCPACGEGSYPSLSKDAEESRAQEEHQRSVEAILKGDFNGPV